MDLNFDFIRIAYALGVIVASVILAKVVYTLIEKYMLQIARKTKSDIDDKLLHLVKKPLYYLIILLGVYVAVAYILVTAASGPIVTLISMLGIIVLVWFAGSLTDLIIKEFGGKLAKHTDSTVDDEALPFLSRVIKIVIYGIAFSMLLEKLGYSITPIIASLGLAGFAIGFAAKDTISNILAGFFILVDRPFKIGDRVELGDTYGDVVDIGLRTTKVKTLDYKIVIVPNSTLVSNNVTNYSLPDIKQKLIIPFGISYGSDVDKAKKIVVEVAKKTPHVLKDPMPESFFIEFADSSLNIKLIVWIEDLRMKWTVKDHINSEVWNRFKKEGIDVPFPVRTVYLHKEK
ncbi:MAG: mechanosensitive ion channel family protein [Methanobacteriota archaeon]